MEMEIKKRNGDTHTVLYDAEDYKKIKKHNWFITNKGYCKTNLQGKHVGMPEVLLGKKPDFKMVYDHVNGDKLDNRKSNLRFTSWAVNNANRGGKARSNTGIRGIHLDKNGFFQTKKPGSGGKRICSKNLADIMTRKALHLAKLGIPLERYSIIFDNDLKAFQGHFADLVWLQFMTEQRT
jgi:hypothetical protein